MLMGFSLYSLIVKMLLLVGFLMQIGYTFTSIGIIIENVVYCLIVGS